MLAPGYYRARAINYDFGIADTGTEQVAVTFEIYDEGEANGQHITWFGYFTEQTQKRTVETLRYCGWDGDDLADLAGIDRNEVEIEIVHENFNGTMRPKVKWVNRPGAGGVRLKTPMDDKQKRALAARLKGLVASTKGISKAPPPPVMPPTPGKGNGASRGYPADWDKPNQGADYGEAAPPQYRDL